jgi:hypothetical protein
MTDTSLERPPSHVRVTHSRKSRLIALGGVAAGLIVLITLLYVESVHAFAPD